MGIGTYMLDIFITYNILEGCRSQCSLYDSTFLKMFNIHNLLYNNAYYEIFKHKSFIAFLNCLVNIQILRSDI